MDRFDDKAREICNEAEGWHQRLLDPAFVRLTAAILRAAAEMGKPVMPPTCEGCGFVPCAGKGGECPGKMRKAKPVAGEWAIGPDGTRVRRVRGRTVAVAEPDDGFGVLSKVSDGGIDHGDVWSSQAAADEWARTHANDLDWCLPEPVEQPAPLSPDLMARMAEALRPIAEMAVGRESWQDDSFGTGESVPLYLARHARALLAEYDDATKEPTP